MCRFQAARPPGIYKDEYIQTLFEYYHEERNAAVTQTPMLPSWKAANGDESPEHFGIEDPNSSSAQGVVPSCCVAWLQLAVVQCGSDGMQ
jgi:hypothetical protein